MNFINDDSFMLGIIVGLLGGCFLASVVNFMNNFGRREW